MVFFKKLLKLIKEYLNCFLWKQFISALVIPKYFEKHYRMSLVATAIYMGFEDRVLEKNGNK